jgi:Na+/melibiose symporter-like transporter
MLDLRLFGDRRFAVSSGGITLVFFAMFGTFFMFSQYLQFVLGYTPLGAAVRLLPFSAVMMTVAPQTPKLVARFGANRVASFGLTLVAVGMVTMVFYWHVVVTAVFLSSGMAMTMSPMTTQLMSAVPRDRAGIGSAMNDTTRELGGALGVAVLGSLVTSRYSSGLESSVSALPAELRDVATASIGGVDGLISRGVLPEAVATTLRETAERAFVDGIALAATVAAVVVVLAAFAVRRFLPADRFSPAVTGEPSSPEVSDAASVGD